MERIRYHVPEDGDDAAHPNVFELVSEGAVRVGDVRRDGWLFTPLPVCHAIEEASRRWRRAAAT